MAVKLNESGVSRITDSKLSGEMLDVIYGGSDNRPAWIGGHRPATDIELLKPQASWASTHYDFYLSFVRDYMEPRCKVLDIGCGAGQNTAMLARYSDSSTGIDSDPKAARFAEKYNTVTGAKFILGTFPEYIPPLKMDYIFCIETMEHIPYEKQFRFLDSALELLETGGLMFVTTPNEEIVEPPHIGIWTTRWLPRILEHLTGRIKKRGYFDNENPDAGILSKPSSHYAFVLGQ